ncbi:hypothetical protein NEDG_01015 [Nematocida displodere]|uniref:C2H2-type domain-containing protein n=1 Tax=Nematocida displodere TaxID=1805483 RepID=A0A177EAX4_9MICR|nr:hypothetical protein NEDG_01015 [Nematocida displodere]
MSGIEEEFIAETEDTKRSKPAEGSAVLQMQTEAVEKLKAISTRAFQHTKASIATVGGSKLWVNSWCSPDAPKNQKATGEPIEASTTCNICQRVFLDRRRLAIHKNVHMKTESKNS